MSGFRFRFAHVSAAGEKQKSFGRSYLVFGRLGGLIRSFMTLRHVYIALVACAVMCGTSLAYQEPSACLDADGEDMGVQCVYVDVGLTCPKNFYCPTYTVGEAITYATMLSDNNCTVSSSAVVQCPCPPGFYCPANMGQPTYCPAGYYCPADPSAIATATSAGLGAWGGVAKICPEGFFCALA